MITRRNLIGIIAMLPLVACASQNPKYISYVDAYGSTDTRQRVDQKRIEYLKVRVNDVLAQNPELIVNIKKNNTSYYGLETENRLANALSEALGVPYDVNLMAAMWSEYPKYFRGD